MKIIGKCVRTLSTDSLGLGQIVSSQRDRSQQELECLMTLWKGLILEQRQSSRYISKETLGFTHCLMTLPINDQYTRLD